MSKQQLIVQKSIELFSQKSISKTSIQDITEACGISKGAFYLNFKSKDDLLIHIVDQLIQELTISFQNLLDEESLPREKLEKFCYATISLFNERFPLFKMLLAENTKGIQSELLLKLKIFDESINRISITLLENVYGEKIQHNKFDIQVCLKGILQGYTDFIVHHKQSIPFKLVGQTIIHYIDALVEMRVSPILTSEHFHSEQLADYEFPTIRELIFEEIEICKKKYEPSSFVGQSIQIIEDELSKEFPNFVILSGMAANLKPQAELQWLVTLVRQYSPAPIQS